MNHIRRAWPAEKPDTIVEQDGRKVDSNLVDEYLPGCTDALAAPITKTFFAPPASRALSTAWFGPATEPSSAIVRARKPCS
jgi:hypothetical protein